MNSSKVIRGLWITGRVFLVVGVLLVMFQIGSAHPIRFVPWYAALIAVAIVLEIVQKRFNQTHRQALNHMVDFGRRLGWKIDFSTDASVLLPRRPQDLQHTEHQNSDVYIMRKKGEHGRKYLMCEQWWKRDPEGTPVASGVRTSVLFLFPHFFSGWCRMRRAFLSASPDQLPPVIIESSPELLAREVWPPPIQTWLTTFSPLPDIYLERNRLLISYDFDPGPEGITRLEAVLDGLVDKLYPGPLEPAANKA